MGRAILQSTLVSNVEAKIEVLYGFEGNSDARCDSPNTSRELSELREGKVGGAGAELKIGGVE